MSRQDLINYILANITQNTTGDITGNILRTILRDITNSLHIYTRVETVQDRDSIVSEDRYPGMLVKVQNTDRIYYLKEDESTWGELVDTSQMNTALNDKADQLEVDSISNDLTTTEQNLSGHIEDSLNPHNVTKEQIELGNVINEEQVTQSEVGAPSGVPPLDTNGIIDLQFINDSLKLNTTIVKSEEDLPELVNGKHPLEGSYLIQGSVTLQNPLRLIGDTEIRGFGPRIDQLTYMGEDDFIETNQQSLNCFTMSFNCPNTTLFNATGTAGKHLLFNNIGFYDINSIGGSFDGYDFVKISNALMRSSELTNEGWNFNGQVGKILLSTMAISDLDGVPAVTFGPNFNGYFKIIDNWFKDNNFPYISVNSEATFTKEVIIESNEFENKDNPFEGFDPSSNGYIINNNPGIENSSSYIDTNYTDANGQEISIDSEDFSVLNVNHETTEAARFNYNNTDNYTEYEGIRPLLIVFQNVLVLSVSDNNRRVEFRLERQKEGEETWNSIPGSSIFYTFGTAGSSETVMFQKRIRLNEKDKIRVTAKTVSNETVLTLYSSNIII